MLSIVQHDNDGKRSAAAARCDLVEKGPLAAAVSFLQQSPQITPQHSALVDVRALQASFCRGVEIGDYLLDALVQAATKKEIGTVGGFIYEVVEMLKEYVKLDPKSIKAFKKLCGRETCFDWEEPLVKIFDEQDID